MNPLVSYDVMYACAALLVVLVLTSWGLYALYTRKRPNRYRLSAPDRSIRRHVDTEFAGRS